MQNARAMLLRIDKRKVNCLIRAWLVFRQKPSEIGLSRGQMGHTADTENPEVEPYAEH